MDATGEQIGPVAAPISPVPLHAVAALAAMQAVVAPPTTTSMAIIQEGSPAAGGVVEDRVERVMQQLKWIEKLVFVSIFLALYAIIKK